MMNEAYIEFGGYIGFIKANALCGITGEPLAESEQIYIVQLPDKANWPFPVWGDYPLGTNARALAFISQEAVNENGIPAGTITSAVEVNETEIIYHPVTFKIADNATIKKV